MYIRKSNISRLIKKEREKERLECEKENRKKIKNLRAKLENKQAQILKELKAEYKKTIKLQTSQIQNLKREIEKNHNAYLNIRLREKQLNVLYHEMEAEISKMTIKVHESTQPFYRTMSKIELAKKKSDKKHEEFEKVFSIVS